MEFRTNENVSLRAFTGSQLFLLFHLSLSGLSRNLPFLCTTRESEHIFLVEAWCLIRVEAGLVIHLHMDNKVIKWALLAYFPSQYLFSAANGILIKQIKQSLFFFWGGGSFLEGNNVLGENKSFNVFCFFCTTQSAFGFVMTLKSWWDTRKRLMQFFTMEDKPLPW